MDRWLQPAQNQDHLRRPSRFLLQSKSRSKPPDQAPKNKEKDHQRPNQPLLLLCWQDQSEDHPCPSLVPRLFGTVTPWYCPKNASVVVQADCDAQSNLLPTGKLWK